jgi:hypothetical protein
VYPQYDVFKQFEYLNGYKHACFTETRVDFKRMATPGVENFVGQAQAQGFLNFLNPSPVSDLRSPNL